jgi:hypothetical protein
MPDKDLTSELAQSKEEIEALRRRLELLEQRFQAIPETLLLSKNPTVRTLAVLGHVLLGCLAIYIVMILVTLLIG